MSALAPCRGVRRPPAARRPLGENTADFTTAACGTRNRAEHPVCRGFLWVMGAGLMAGRKWPDRKSRWSRCDFTWRVMGVSTALSVCAGLTSFGARLPWVNA